MPLNGQKGHNENITYTFTICYFPTWFLIADRNLHVHCVLVTFSERECIYTLFNHGAFTHTIMS